MITPVPDVDELANFIRTIDGNNRLGAGALAQNIAEWLLAATPSPQEPTVAQAQASERAVAYRAMKTGALYDAAHAEQLWPDKAEREGERNQLRPLVYAHPQVIDKVDAEVERIAFEAWAVTEGFNVERGSKGLYTSLGTNQQFSGWLARAATQTTGGETP